MQLKQRLPTRPGRWSPVHIWDVIIREMCAASRPDVAACGNRLLDDEARSQAVFRAPIASTEQWTMVTVAKLRRSGLQRPGSCRSSNLQLGAKFVPISFPNFTTEAGRRLLVLISCRRL